MKLYCFDLSNFLPRIYLIFEVENTNQDLTGRSIITGPIFHQTICFTFSFHSLFFLYACTWSFENLISLKLGVALDNYVSRGILPKYVWFINLANFSLHVQRSKILYYFNLVSTVHQLPCHVIWSLFVFMSFDADDRNSSIWNEMTADVLYILWCIVCTYNYINIQLYIFQIFESGRRPTIICQYVHSLLRQITKISGSYMSELSVIIRFNIEDVHKKKL